MSQEFDVAIVGFGPVGATLANLLGLHGCRTVVLEQDTEIFPVPRAVHADDEALRTFQSLGLLESMRPALGTYTKREYLNAKGEIFFEASVRKTTAIGHREDIYFHQPTLEAVLRGGLTRFEHVDTRLGMEVEKIEQDNVGVTLTARQAETGKIETIRSKYVVGCDGARSLVRQQLNIRLRDLGFDQPWLVLDVRLKPDVTPKEANLPNCHQQYCDPRQPVTYVPTAVKGHYRWEFMQIDKPAPNSVPPKEQVRNLLSSVVDPSNVEIQRVAIYTFHALIAKQWRVERALLAGDAAHQMPPFAGQGMCSGLRDVHNLSWKLALVVKGASSDELLNSYAVERIPHVTRMTRGTIFLGNLIQTRSFLGAYLRDILFKTILRIPRLFTTLASFTLRSPNLKKGVLGGEISRAKGKQFIQPTVLLDTDEAVPLDSVLGDGFSVLTIAEHDDVLTKLADTLITTTLPITFVQVANGKVTSNLQSGSFKRILDVEGKLVAWFRKYRAQFVIIRPDRYVLGAYTATGLNQGMKELFSLLCLHSNTGVP